MLGEYNAASLRMANKWKLVRDFVAGEEDVKAAGELYLPRKGGQSDCSYEAYKARAKVGDYTGQALSSLHGLIFRRTPVIDIPDSQELRKVVDNFNREGDSLYQFASDTAMDNMQTLWGGILADMPSAEGIVTAYDAEVMGLRPYARYYSAENIYDWRYRDVNGFQQLSMVVLKELVENDVMDEFSHDVTEQIRVLSLDEDGLYNVRIYRKREVEEDGGKKTVYDLVSAPSVVIRGRRLGYIPFEFLMGKSPDKPMLYGTAELHKHYYMQSADYENGVHYTTIPTGCSTGHTMGKDENGQPEVIRLGEDAWLNFPEETARVSTLIFSGEGLDHCENAIDRTKEEIGVLGTRMISPDKSMSETKDAAQIHRQGENAKLATYARNLSEKFTRILQVMAGWMGIEGKVNVEFNVDYDSVAFDPNALNAIANLAREGKYPLPLVFEALKKGEYLPNDIDFKVYALLVALEDSGASVSEILAAYQRLRAGEKVEVIDTKPAQELREDSASGDGEPEKEDEDDLDEGDES